MLPITRHRRKYYVLSGLLTGLSLAAWLMWGLKPGIDFTGGSLLELGFTGTRPTVEQVAQTGVASTGSEEVTAQPLGESGVILRMPPIDETAHQKLSSDLKAAYEKDGVT